MIRWKVVIAMICNFVMSCTSQPVLDKTVVIENSGAFDQIGAVMVIPVSDLGDLSQIDDLRNVLVMDLSDESLLVTQWVDHDQDEKMDELLFEASLNSGNKKDIRVFWKENGHDMQPAPKVQTFSRFIPERIDDYAWENDKVAFRTFGPEAERLAVEKLPGATLTSGIDLWLKKVEYPIIDKWYAKNLEESGYYHKDHGEGYDPYHVGKSRGTGGIGVWKGDTLLVSNNFTAYRTIAIGPLRTVFELDYAPWSEFGIQETKRISLDLGTNFSKVEISLSPNRPVPNYTIGITLHEGEGEVILNDEKGYFSHWEQIEDAFVGEGIVIDPRFVRESFEHRIAVTDQSQLLILTEGTQKTLTYYTGFAWTGSGQVTVQKDWLQMIQKQADRVANPIVVALK